MEYSTPTISQTLDKIKNLKNIKTFDDAINSVSYWKRHIIIGELDSEEMIGETVEGLIRFWNMYDDENNIPVEEREPIKIYINSPGGDLAAAFTIIDSIIMSKTPVWTINIGMAYSGGFFIYIVGDKRFAFPHSSFLFHEGATEIGCDAGKFQNFTAFYKHQLDQLRDIVLKYTTVSEDLYKEKRRDDWWLDADEAVKYGIVDQITEELVY